MQLDEFDVAAPSPRRAFVEKRFAVRPGPVRNSEIKPNHLNSPDVTTCRRINASC